MKHNAIINGYVISRCLKLIEIRVKSQFHKENVLVYVLRTKSTTTCSEYIPKSSVALHEMSTGLSLATSLKF